MIYEYSSEVCIPVKFTVQIDDETGHAELSTLEVTGPIAAAIDQRRFFENLPDREEECLIEIARDAIKKEAADAEDRAIADRAEDHLYIGS